MFLFYSIKLTGQASTGRRLPNRSHADVAYAVLGTHGPCQAPFLSCHAFARFIPTPQRWRTIVIAGAVTASSCSATGAAGTGAASPIRATRETNGTTNA